MNRISKKEYSTNVFKYLKPGKMILTSHGKDSLLITIAPLSEENSTSIRSNSTVIEPNSTPIKDNSTSIDKPNSTPIDNVTNNNNNVTNNSNVTNIHQQKVTTSPSKAERIDTAKKIGLKTADGIPAPKEVTKAFPGIKTQADYESHQARQKEKEHRMVHYGCGCKKTDESLCGKHGKR